MNLFNEQSFAEMLTNCYNNECYQAVVMLDNEEQKREFVEELHRNHNENPIIGVRSITVRYPYTFIEFENESEIEIITPNDLNRMRGYRCNEALLDANILDFDAIETLEHMIIEYAEAVALGITQRMRRRPFADRTINRMFMNEAIHSDSIYDMEKWNVLEVSSPITDEITVDKQGSDALDDFLKSFQKNTLQSGS